MGKQRFSSFQLAEIKRPSSGWFFCHACQKWGTPKDKEKERCSHCSKLLFEALVYKERQRACDEQEPPEKTFKCVEIAVPGKSG